MDQEFLESSYRRSHQPHPALCLTHSQLLRCYTKDSECLSDL